MFYVFRCITLGILAFLLYIDLSFLFGNFEVVDGRYFMTIPPFGSQISGDYQMNVIVTISLILFFGVLFFHVITAFFAALKFHTIFTQKAIVQLRYLAVLNLVVGPIIYFLIHFPIMQKTDFRDIHNLILHIVIGIIALFVSHIFKSGYVIQSENDLTI